MVIGDLTIITPIDDPCAYEPSWRHMLAQAISSREGYMTEIEPVYRSLCNDLWVKRYRKMLWRQRQGMALTEDQSYAKMARSWFDNPSPAGVRFRLEPLLLTGATMDTIMLDISGGTVPTAVFTWYEKLFFNIRDEEGRLSKSIQLRNSFAQPNGDDLGDASPQEIWKAIACHMGYDVLMHTWLWKDAHGLAEKGSDFLLDETWRAAQSRLFQSVFADRVGHKSLSDILSAYTSQFKMLREQKLTSNGGDDTTKALMAVLYQTSPKMVAVSRDVDAMSAKTKEIQSRITAQLAIDKQQIEDKGKAVSDAVIDTQIVEAVSR